MKTLSRRGFYNSNLSAEETQAVSLAILMNPSEVYEFTRSYEKEQRKTLRGSWSLGGIVSEAGLNEIRANIGKTVVHEITVKPTLAGAAYAVVSTQLGDWQHRFLLPLYQSKVIELFAGASREPLSLHFYSACDDQGSVYYRRVFSAEDFEVASAVSRALVLKNRAAFVREIPLVISDILNPSQGPSSSTTDMVREVEVSVLMTRSDIATHLLDDRLERVC